MNYIINRIIKTTSRLILVFIFIGCKQNSSKESEILAIPLSVSIERFDKEFYLSNPEVIPKLKKKTIPFCFLKSLLIVFGLIDKKIAFN